MAERRCSRSRASNAYYGRAQALEDVSFEIAGGATSIIGRNGMGKTTLCNAIVGVPPARVTGSIRFQGKELVGKPSYKIAKLGIGYVPQGRRLFPSLSVDEHLRMISVARRLEALDGRARVRALPAAAGAQAQRRRAALRRRAADARDRARAAHEPDAPDHGRAVRGARAGDHRAPRRDVQEARAGRARDPADRAEPRRRDVDRRAPARDGRGLDLRRDDRDGADRRIRSCSAASSASSRSRSARSADRRPARHARHEGRRVRVPARPAARARRRRAPRRRGRPRAGRLEPDIARDEVASAAGVARRSRPRATAAPR